MLSPAAFYGAQPFTFGLPNANASLRNSPSDHRDRRASSHGCLVAALRV